MKVDTMAKRLIERGYSQTKICEMLAERGTRCTQPTLSRIVNGADPSYTLGHAIHRLYVEKCEAPKEARQ